MSPQEIKIRIRQYLTENVLMAASAASLADNASFIERNLLDSTGVLELVAFLETTYGIKVTDEEIIPDNLDSLDLIAAYVVRKKGAV